MLQAEILEHSSGYKTLEAGESLRQLLPKDFQNPHYKRHDVLGWNYRMNELTAAVGLAQLERVEFLVERRKKIAKMYDDAFKDCDFILTPTTPSAAFPIGEKEDDPIKMYLNDIFTVPASLAGIPGISIPFGKSKNKLPLGIQLLSKHFNEQMILNAGLYLEKNNV